jgi:hypothetical protein
MIGRQRGTERVRAHLGLLLAAALLTACAATQPAPMTNAAPLEISPATDGALRTYLQVIRHNPAAFAVSVDGNNSFMAYCPDRICMENFFGSEATRRCESLSGEKCVLLFIGRQPRQAYSVAADRNISGRHGSRTGIPRDWMFPY